MPRTPVEQFDAVLVGGGVMSATLGLLLAELQPDWRIAAGFPGRMPDWAPRLREIAPSSADLARLDAGQLEWRRTRARRVLGLDPGAAASRRDSA